ncbi:MAG: hypothetical protein R2747_20395 [Pyrinomonadaceae bacterium]
MKFCPKCRSRFADETLSFCLQDGTELIEESPAETEMPTVAFGSEEEIYFRDEKTEEFQTGDKTEQFPGPPATESYTTNRDLGSISDQPAESSDPGYWEASRETRVASVSPKPAKGNFPNALVAVLATALVMLLLVGGAGIALWLYFSSPDRPLSDNEGNKERPVTVPNKNSPTVETPAPTVPATKSPEEKETPVSTPDQKETPVQSPPSEFDPGEAKKEVAARVNGWISLAEQRDLNSYMGFYAEKLDYYNKKGASRSFVSNDKSRAFRKFTQIEITPSKLNVTVDASGNRATAVFDKEWFFAGSDSTSRGKVQSQLKFSRIGGQWKIVSERDLKVYYVK